MELQFNEEGFGTPIKKTSVPLSVSQLISQSMGLYSVQ